MSEIVLNYTGLDNVPGKIVFNKSSDYFEWMNRNKSKVESEVCEIDINEVKANGTYIIKPEKEGTYYSQVKIAVDVPRRNVINSIGFTVDEKSAILEFSKMELVEITKDTDLFGDDAILSSYEITDSELPTTLSIGHVAEGSSIKISAFSDGYALLMIYGYGDNISFVLSSGDSGLTLPVNAYVIVLHSTITSETRFGYGFYKGENPIVVNEIPLTGFFNGTINDIMSAYSKSSHDYSEVYAKCPALEN